MFLRIDLKISGDKILMKEAEEILKYKEITIKMQLMWNVKKKSDTSNTGPNWCHIKIFQNMSEQRKWKAHQEATEKNHT
jgi:hypothetical protein